MERVFPGVTKNLDPPEDVNWLELDNVNWWALFHDKIRQENDASIQITGWRRRLNSIIAHDNKLTNVGKPPANEQKTGPIHASPPTPKADDEVHAAGGAERGIDPDQADAITPLMAAPNTGTLGNTPKKPHHPKDEAPPPEPPKAFFGYLGSRNLENSDILNAPTNPRGDAITPAKGVVNARQDTLRPQYGIANPMDAIPSQREQIKSDIIFSDFSQVAPGFGLGVTNAMFLQEQKRDAKIVYAEPMSEPRRDDGPTGTVLPPPFEWQPLISRSDRKQEEEYTEKCEARKMLAVHLVGTGSLNILGDDYGQFRAISDKGLHRPADSPFEPIVMRPSVLEKLRVPAGQHLQYRDMRRLFDGLRHPEHWKETAAQSGGPTIDKQKGYALLPFAVSMA